MDPSGGWRLVSALEEGKLLLEGGGMRVIGMKGLMPWPLEVVREIRRLALASSARSCSVVGAHIGEPLVALAGRCPRIAAAYEPDPAKCYLMEETLELNELKVPVRCEWVSSGESRRSIYLDGAETTVEVVGVNRVVNGRVDLVMFLCEECASAASGLDCSALSLSRGYVFPRSSGLGRRLIDCGFSVRRSAREALALSPSYV